MISDDPSSLGHGEPGIAVLLSRTIADVEQVVRAEIELQRARAAAKVDSARHAILMMISAVVISGAALTALVVGALMVLAPLVGPLWATVIVVVVLVGTSSLLGWLSLQSFKRVFGAVEEAP